MRFLRPAVPCLAVLLLGGCASSDTQRYFAPRHAAQAQAAGTDARVLFVRQSERELVVLVRVANQGPGTMTLSPTGPTPSWSVAIGGRTLALTESDRTYWSAWSGTTTRDRSPLKVARDLAVGESLDVEVRWRLEPPLADEHAPWVLTLANVLRQGVSQPPLVIRFPAADADWHEAPEVNPNRVLRPGQRGWTNTRPWQVRDPRIEE